MHHDELLDAHTIASALLAALNSGTPESLWNMANKMKRTGSLQEHLEAIEKAILVNDALNIKS